jgi:purine nucleosidase
MHLLRVATRTLATMLLGLAFMPWCAVQASAQRYVIADQDASGPGGSDMMSLLVLLQSPDVHLLGITVVSGDSWRDEEVAHALRLVEIVGRNDVKVYPGAAFPLVRTLAWTQLANKMYGAATFQGAFSDRRTKTPWDAIPTMREGAPTTVAADEDAAHFMVRMVHKYPHQVTIYAAGPLTNVALAIRLDPHFAELAQELVVMGGSIVPNTQAAEWVNNPRHEFNFWFDPEAASIALEAPWAKITTTTIDVSLKTRPDPEVLDGVARAHSPAAEYVTQYARRPVLINYLWDELAAAAWIDPTLITGERYVYMDVNTEHGPNYGDTLTWAEEHKPALPLNKVHAQMNVDLPRLQRFLIEVLSHPAPHFPPPNDKLVK